MAITFEDMKNRLKRLDEVTLLEVLDISSEELVDRFTDLIEDHFDELEDDFEQDLEEDTEDSEPNY